MLTWYSSLSAQSDSTERLRFGAMVGGGVSLHTAEFQELVGLPSCCPLYRSGTGIAPTVGVFFEFPLASRVTEGIRLLLTDVSGRLTSVEPSTTITGSNISAAQIEHSIDATIRGIGIEPVTNFRLLKQFSAFVGMRADVAMKGNVSQREELLLPEVGTFENGKRIRNEASGGIYGMQPLMMSFLGGFRFSFPMNKDNSVLLMPELSFSLGMNSLIYNKDWRVHTMRLGVGIAFQSPRLPVSAADVTAVPAPNIAADLITAAFDGTEENPDLPIRVDEFETENIHPLLPMIFFEHNSDALPARYRFLTRDEAVGYSPDKVYGSTALSTYYSVLNIIGFRMKQHPTETITLIGYNADVDIEKANTQLSRRRAENVSQYLQQVWAIDRKRIIVEGRNKPESASVGNQRDAIAENRRVEIRASPSILAPVVVRSTRFVPSPQYIRLHPASGGSDIVDRWEIKIYQSGDAIKTMNGSGGLPLKLQIDLRDEAITLQSTDSLRAAMVVNGRTGIASSAATAIRTDGWTLARKNVDHSTDTVFVSSSMLFARDNSTDEELSSAFVRMIKAHIQPEVTLMLIDHKSSNAEYAKKIQSWLGVESALILNRDDTVAPYSSTFPEGRLYNNAVEIRIRKAVRR